MALEQCALLVSLLRVLAIANVLLAFPSATSAEEASDEVAYVTGCLGGDAVTLHPATSSGDARAVFVYKGSEILGSDIIPAQGDYKGRLKISRLGEVTLSDLRLTDSGVFRVETAKRKGKTSTYVVLVLPEAPATQDNRLHVLTVLAAGNLNFVRLTCGTFTTLGYPPATVLWKDPNGRLLSSTGHSGGDFFLDITDTSPPGNYSCFVHCQAPANCCLPPGSKLLHHAHAHVAPVVTTSVTPEITPDLTSALQKTGEDMAAGMAALVNDQMQETFDTNQQRLEAWKEELQQRMEDRLEEMRNELELVLEDKLEERGGRWSESAIKRERSFKAANPLDVNVGRSTPETEAYDKVEKSLRMIFQQLDEGKRNTSKIQKKLDDKVAFFQKKLHWLRKNVKKHGLFKHGSLIERLSAEMNEKFEEINSKFSDQEAARQLTDEEILNTFEQIYKEIDNRMNQGKTNIDNFLENITDKIEDLQKKMSSMEEQLRKLERKKLDMSLSEDDADDIINDTKLKVERNEKENVQERKDDDFGQRTMAGTGFSGQQGKTVSTPINITLSESCVEAQRKGGTVSGAYSLFPDGLDAQPFWCDMENGGGGWLVFQRRRDGSVEFYRPWLDYVEGFGDPSSDGEFWLGLDKLHLITTSRPHSLRVDLRTFDGREGSAYYRHFRVLSSHQDYLMAVYGYTGTAGDSLIVHDSQPFSTWDKDNDGWKDGHCAENYRSAWWYAGCRICDLNAPYTTKEDGIMWLYGDEVWGAGKIAFVEMKIRPE